MKHFVCKISEKKYVNVPVYKSEHHKGLDLKRALTQIIYLYEDYEISAIPSDEVIDSYSSINTCYSAIRTCIQRYFKGEFEVHLRYEDKEYKTGKYIELVYIGGNV